MYIVQTLTLLSDAGSGDHTMAYRNARNLPVALRIHHGLGAGDDVQDQLVRREIRLDLSGSVSRSLALDVREKREHRGFEDCHGMALSRGEFHRLRN